MIPDSFPSLYCIKTTSADFVHSKFAANLNDCNEVLRLVCLWLRCPFRKKSCYAKYENTSVHQSKLSLTIYTKTMHFITLGIQLVQHIDIIQNYRAIFHDNGIMFYYDACHILSHIHLKYQSITKYKIRNKNRSMWGIQIRVDAGLGN